MQKKWILRLQTIAQSIYHMVCANFLDQVLWYVEIVCISTNVDLYFKKVAWFWDRVTNILFWHLLISKELDFYLICTHVVVRQRQALHEGRVGGRMEAGTVCGAWGDTVAGYTTGGMGLGTDPYALYMPWLQRRGRPLNTIQETRGEVDCPTPHQYLSTCNGLMMQRQMISLIPSGWKSGSL